MSASVEDSVIISTFVIVAWGADGSVAPVQENVIRPAAAETPFERRTVNTSEAYEAVLARTDGEVNVQTGVAGQTNPVKVTSTFPPDEIAVAVDIFTLTLTPVAAVTAFDKVIDAPDMAAAFTI
jgi:hypothetical protein